MKLTKKRLIESLRILEVGGTVYKASKEARITVGYTYKLWNKYKQSGMIPEIGLKVGKPIKQINEREKKLIKEFYEKYRTCASRLVKRIELSCQIKIPVYTAHKIMIQFWLCALCFSHLQTFFSKSFFFIIYPTLI
jgi:hypothetical protein